MVNKRNDLVPTLAGIGVPGVEWQVSRGLIPYADALAAMDARANAIANGTAAELAWLLEHPPIYTAGTSADVAEVRQAAFPVYATGRGGQLTYHGPGQRVVYLMVDLKRRGGDVRCYVAALEAWVIATLARFNVRGERREERVGVWVRRPDKGEGREDKIAAIGVRVRRGVTLHGVSLNVEPDLRHYAGIVPCGIVDPRLGVTSLVDLGHPVTLPEVDTALRACFEPLFGSVLAEIDEPARRLCESSTPYRES